MDQRRRDHAIRDPEELCPSGQARKQALVGSGQPDLPAKREQFVIQRLPTPGVEMRGNLVQQHQRRHLPARSEEHTSELQSLMRNSNAVFCLKKKKNNNRITKRPAPKYNRKRQLKTKHQKKKQ